MITLACPSCAVKLQIPSKFAGKKITCPKCKASVQLSVSAVAPTTYIAADPPPPNPKPKAPAKPAPVESSKPINFSLEDDFSTYDPASPPPAKSPKKRIPEPEPEPEEELAEQEAPGFDFLDDAPPPSPKKPKKRPPDPEPEEEPAEPASEFGFGDEEPVPPPTRTKAKPRRPDPEPDEEPTPPPPPRSQKRKPEPEPEEEPAEQAGEFGFGGDEAPPPTPTRGKKRRPEPEPEEEEPAEPASEFGFGDDEAPPPPTPTRGKKRQPDPEPEEEEPEEPPAKMTAPAKSKKPAKPSRRGNRLLWMTVAGGGLAAALLIGAVVYWNLMPDSTKVATAALKGDPTKKGDKSGEKSGDKGDKGKKAAAKVPDEPEKPVPPVNPFQIENPFGPVKQPGEVEKPPVELAKPAVEPDNPPIPVNPVPVNPAILPAGPEVADAVGPAPPMFSDDATSKAKKSTAYIKVVSTGGKQLTGSGWFGLRPGIVVTNAHVLDMLMPDAKQLPTKVEVVVNSGLPSEKTFAGQVIGVDRENDLALLAVDGQAKDWPAPLPLAPSETLKDLQNVMICGFPLGEALGAGMRNPEITTTPSTIGSYRRNEAGQLRYLQINGGMAQGNSGGPVVDTRGAVIGVSVSVMKGTQINFAVPSDKVKQFASGRVVDTRIFEPFKEGDAVRVPVEVKTLDPMKRIKEAKVEIWAGAAGKVRAGGSAAAEKKDGDGPRASFDAQLNEETARADLTMPAVAKGQALWVQPVLIDDQGRKFWGNAEALTPSGLPPLERVPVPFKVAVDRTEDRTIELKERKSLRAAQGINDRETAIIALEAKLLEKASPTPNGGQILLYLGAADREQSINGKSEKMNPAVFDIVRRAPIKYAFAPDGRVAVYPSINFDPKLDGNLRTVLADIYSGITNLYQSALFASTPPNAVINPNTTWLNQKASINIPFGDRIETLATTTAWTYEGQRTIDGRRQAYCRVNGFVRGTSPQLIFFNSRIEGHAHFDVEGGYVSQSQIRIVTEIDQAQGKIGTLTIEFDFKRVMGNPYSIAAPAGMPAAMPVAMPVAMPAGASKLKSIEAKIEPNDTKIPKELMMALKVAAEKAASFPHKAFKLKLEKDKIYVIDMIRIESPKAEAKDMKFDPLLILHDKALKMAVTDDDSAGDLNARIVFKCPESDTYRLLATCMPPHLSSAFRIDVYCTDAAAVLTLEADP